MCTCMPGVRAGWPLAPGAPSAGASRPKLQMPAVGGTLGLASQAMLKSKSFFDRFGFDLESLSGRILNPFSIFFRARIFEPSYVRETCCSRNVTISFTFRHCVHPTWRPKMAQDSPKMVPTSSLIVFVCLLVFRFVFE